MWLNSMRERRLNSARPSTVKDSPGGGEKNLQIEPDRPRLAVTQVQADHFIEACTIASAHLPQSCYPGPHFENPAPVPDIINLEFVWDGRTRADERHIAAQDVPELRQLIETGLPEESSNESHSRILDEFVNRLFRALGIVQSILAGDELLDVFLMDLGIVVGIHRPKLQALEARAKLAQAFLLIDHWTFGSQLDQGDDERQEG